MNQVTHTTDRLQVVPEILDHNLHLIQMWTLPDLTETKKINNQIPWNRIWHTKWWPHFHRQCCFLGETDSYFNVMEFKTVRDLSRINLWIDMKDAKWIRNWGTETSDACSCLRDGVTLSHSIIAWFSKRWNILQSSLLHVSAETTFRETKVSVELFNQPQNMFLKGKQHTFNLISLEKVQKQNEVSWLKYILEPFELDWAVQNTLLRKWI